VTLLGEEHSDRTEEIKGKSAAEMIVLHLKEVRDKVEQLSHSFEDVQNLNKTIKDMTSTVNGLDTKVKGLNELVNAVVRNTRELSEDIKSNTALMNMMMRAFETRSMERETALLKNIEMSTDLIEKFTALVKSQTEASSGENE
jgi:methyl-accepting chemotaxis protein